MKFYLTILGLLALAALAACSSDDDPAPRRATPFTFSAEAGSPLQADGSFGDPDNPTQPWQAPAGSVLDGVTLIAPVGGFSNAESVGLSIDESDMDYLNPGNLPILSPVIRLLAPFGAGSSLAKPEVISTDEIHPISGEMTIRIPFTMPAGENSQDARLFQEDGYGHAREVDAQLEGVPMDVDTPTEHAFIYTGTWASRFWVINASKLIATEDYLKLDAGNTWTLSRGDFTTVATNGVTNPNLDHLPWSPIHLDHQESTQYIFEGQDGLYLAGELDFDGTPSYEFIYLDEKTDRPIRWIPEMVTNGQTFSRKVRIEERGGYVPVTAEEFSGEPTLSEATITLEYSFLDELTTTYGIWEDLLVVYQTDSEGGRERFYFAKDVGLVYFEEGDVGTPLGNDYVNSATIGGTDLANFRKIDTGAYIQFNAGNRWNFANGAYREVFAGQSAPNLSALDGQLLELRHADGGQFFQVTASGTQLVAETDVDGGNQYQEVWRDQTSDGTALWYPKVVSLGTPNTVSVTLDRREMGPLFTDMPMTSGLQFIKSFDLLATYTTTAGTFSDVLRVSYHGHDHNYDERQYFALGIGVIYVESRDHDSFPYNGTHMTSGTVNGEAIVMPEDG